MRTASFPALVVALALASAAPAGAAVVTAAADDPAGDDALLAPGDPHVPARDITQVRASYDAAGSWSVTVRLGAEPPTGDAEWSMINAAITTLDGDGTCGTAFGTLRASTKPAAGGVSASAGSALDGAQPDGSVGPSPASGTKAWDTAAREITLTASHPRLAGRAAGCVTVTLSRNRPLDELSPALRFPGAVPTPTPTAPGPGAPPSGPPPPAGSAVTIAFAATGVLRPRGGALSVALRPFPVALTGTAAVRRARGPVLARGSWSATPGAVVRVRLRLTAAGRAWLRGHRSTAVRLTVAARPPGAALVTRTVGRRLVR